MAQIELCDLSLRWRTQTAPLLASTSAIFRAGDAVLIAGENGTGKSTLLKTILRTEMRDKIVSGTILLNGRDIRTLNSRALQEQRRRIAWLPQYDAFDALDGYTVADVLYDSFEAHHDCRPSRIDRQWIASVLARMLPPEAGLTLKSPLRKLSGGQQRLVSILSEVGLVEKPDFFLLDEPLNNLDMTAVRLISNLLNRIHLENPDAVMVMVSHCRIFPFINRVLTIGHGQLLESDAPPVCYTCFGQPDAEGFYRM